jgi:hypothetical protein
MIYEILSGRGSPALRGGAISGFGQTAHPIPDAED